MTSYLGRAVIGVVASLCLLSPSRGQDAQDSDAARAIHSFERKHLTDKFYSEGATFADVNRDGLLDVVSGPYWYAAPDFTKGVEFYPPHAFDIEGYSDNFFAFGHDFNGDEWTDILVIGFPGKEAFWFENPQGKLGHWKRHLATPVVDNESPTFTDITGDGRPEIVCSQGGQMGYAEIPDDPTRPWRFQPISPNVGYVKFTHGLGVGDVNNDGRIDILEKNGWWEHPAEGPDAGLWKFHAVKFSDAGGAQMLVYDVDDDGDNDVVTSKAAHAYGLSWFESEPNGDVIAFREHPIMGEKAEENDYGVVFSQLHALALADIDGDGVQDVVTGKRYWAHSDKDPGSLEPAVVYWFRTVRGDDGVDFVPYLADDTSGVGTQVVVDDFNKDGLPDIVVGNKKGTFALVHRKREVDKATWEAAQPKRRETAQSTTASADPPSGTKASNASGVLATAENARVLNLDFERGDLTDWVAEGEAFNGQPVAGDSVHARRYDMVSGHEGDFWVGTYERGGDHLQGTLTSVPFVAKYPYASFRVGGGAGKSLRVDIVDGATGDVIFSASGRNTEQMRPVTVDLRKVLGEEIFIRVVDKGSAGWGHINFDHFRFHESEPTFDEEAGTGQQERVPDRYPFAGLPAEEAARVMELPEGFHAIVSAAEPDVKQPIAMALDDRGRVWVAEAYEYPVRAPEGQGTDRILIFEDRDGDGRFDDRKVFADGLNLVSGLEVGFGGVWVGASPYLLFIPDRDGDDRPDGEPEILLDGWAWHDTHETLNTFIWGPDGWLYGNHGVFTHSRVGKPGTPDEERIPLNAAIWRYHPTRHQFEIFAEGTSNPWGVDFDDHGQAFCTACVIPHLYHIIQGGRYQRQAGSHFNPHTYADIQTIADHRHYVGDNPHGGNGNSNDAGGGHAHSGAMIYLGDAWPDEYRGRIFMNNIHGQRLNTDILKPAGSGYIGSHGPDFLLTGDIASQILNIRYTSDGNAYMIDWYDTNACHHNNVEGHDRSNGRIYKIVFGESKAQPVDLKKLSDKELAELALHKNDWYVRHARRILQERAASGAIDRSARDRLMEIAGQNADATRRLRALWALHVTGGVPQELLSEKFSDEDAFVRAWSIQLALDGGDAPSHALLERFEQMAREDSSPVVRLYLASALQKIAPAKRWAILEALVAHGEDANDHNLPLMYWFAAEPLAEADPERALAFALSCGKTLPQLRDFMLRRIGGLNTSESLAAVVEALGKSSDAEEQQVMIRSLRGALRGQRRVAAPENWQKVYQQLVQSDNEEVRAQATALGVIFGDEAALESFRQIVASPKNSLEQRRASLESLLAADDPGLAKTLLALLGDAPMRDLALRGLAQYDVPQSAEKVLSIYSTLAPAEKPMALATLASRAGTAKKLLEAVRAKQLPTSDLTADLIRQLHNLGDDQVTELLNEVWGTVRSTPADKAAMIANFRKLMDEPPAGVVADPELGRAIFAKTCQQCHTLYGVGNKIGPDLTGSNRSDAEYLLSNIVDPSAVMAKEYQPSIAILVDGRVVTGIVTANDDRAVTMVTATETLVIPRDEIDELTLSDTSMMPDDQLKQFSPAETLSLFAYLRGKAQVPMRATPENAPLLFNGRDLSGWHGDEQLWSVENGEIVGKSAGLAHNSFLISDMAAEDFRLSFQVKLVDDRGNSGVQFRSEPVDGYEAIRGYQADIGPGWWGKLYEEEGRALLWDKSGEAFAKKGEWNDYVIEARGSRVQTWINGQLSVDLDDPDGRRRGVFALQLHSGEPTEVRFRNFKLEVLNGNSAQVEKQAAASK